ncbi:MAG: DUF4838 domain-containing protein [Planctomycetes bacterium]|nr:DUF4838 domain-containing protein [Planctomycetota bacterium]
MQKHVCLLGAVLLAALIASCDGIAIVKDHQPRAAIVLPDDASELLKTACDEMRDLIKEASNAEMEIKPTRPEGTVGIHVGRSPYVDGLKIDLGKLDDDGYVIQFPDPGNIVILGPTDHGTLFGVYEFLERYVGVRWLMPGPDGVDVPKQATINIPTEPVRDKPAFFSRLFSGLRGAAQVEWANHNRMHGRVSFHHNLLHLFPPKEYIKSHPEFFPVHKGKRYFPPPEHVHHGWQPCFSAPGIVDEAIKNINKFFDEHPDATSYSLGVNDSSGHCECEKCRAMDPGRKNFLGRDHLSDRYFTWANQVVEGVLKKHPGKFFGCLAYSEIAEPPDRVKVHPHIIPYMTYDRMKWVQPELRAKGEEMTRAWAKMCPTLAWYDYIYGSPYCVPRVWFHHMADYYRFGYQNGVRAMYAEAYPNFGEGPKLYVSLKLQWDPYQDVDKLLDEWYERCVGPDGAANLKAYYAHWENFWTRRILDSPWFTEKGQYLRFSSPDYLADVAPEEIVQSRAWLESAFAKAKTKKQKARAKLLLRSFEYYEASVLAFPRDDLKGEPMDTEEKAIRVIEGGIRRIEMNEKRRHLQLVEFAKDPVLVHPITMARRGMERLRGEGWGVSDLWRPFDWVVRSKAVRSRLEQLAAKSKSDRVRSHVSAMLQMVDGTAKNLLANSSFEEGKGAGATGWSPWVKWGVGSMRRSDGAAHTGKFSMLCDGMKRGGPHQTLDIQPGRYGAVCFVRTPDGQKPSGTATLGIMPVDGEGKNITNYNVTITPVPGKWTAIANSMEIPATIRDRKVAKLRVILIVDGFQPGDKVYIDDMSLLRLGGAAK